MWTLENKHSGLNCRPAMAAGGPDDGAPAAADLRSFRRILTGDDEPVVRTSLGARLLAIDHTVNEAADGVPALQVLDEPVHEIVFTGIAMPEMNGWELAIQPERFTRRRRDAESPNRVPGARRAGHRLVQGDSSFGLSPDSILA